MSDVSSSLHTEAVLRRIARKTKSDSKETSMKFKIALYPSDEGFAVCVPSLPGCWSQGESEEEALANIAIAIREYLEAEIAPDEGAELREIEVAV